MYSLDVRKLLLLLFFVFPVNADQHIIEHAAIKSVNQSIMQDVLPVDIYESKQEDSKKNVLFKLSFQSVKKTLEDNDVNAVIAEIINVVTKKFNAKLRDN